VPQFHHNTSPENRPLILHALLGATNLENPDYPLFGKPLGDALVSLFQLFADDLGLGDVLL